MTRHFTGDAVLYEELAMSAVSRRAASMREEEREELAAMITNRIVDAWNRGQKG